ncbi:MAG: long-chain fatty acid--CoA ligase [Candidatus Omnitrophica bacterium]|nr:long-chain fatty acid--CoA ligase [Candidatus Omnitrophota bacterium]
MTDWTTIPQMVMAQARRYQGRAALKARGPRGYGEISWDQLLDQVEKIALGLLDQGLEPGDRAAILSGNRPEWAVADLAVLSAGGVTVPVYTSLTPAEIEHILRDSGAKFIFVSSVELLGKVLGLIEPLQLKVVLMDAPYRVSGPRIWWWGEMLGLGQTASDEARGRLAERVEHGKEEDLCSIIYTSGTTGAPKGVMLTHANFLSNCRAVRETLPIDDRDTLLSFLPLSHVFERMAGYYFALSAGATIAYAESMETVAKNLMEVRPTIITGVPRFYEKMKERIEAAVTAASPLKRRIFHWAIGVARERARRKLAGKPVPPGLALRFALADRLAFSKLRLRLGGRLRFGVSGSAPLSRQVAEFFYAAGVMILEGYGLTETSPVITCNRPDRLRFGTVGLPLPGVEVKIAEDGEILTRGPHVMKGYYNNPAATAEVIDPEGWFHTGDVGSFDAEGFLSITDRKKDLIKTSGGKMVAPQNLENALKKDPYIADCMVIGDRRKYITALLVPEMEKTVRHARSLRLPVGDPQELVRRPDIHRFFWERVEQLNRELATFEQIKKITLLAEPFSQAAGQLTPTLKVKRRAVAERYAEQIEAMYHEV